MASASDLVDYFKLNAKFDLFTSTTRETIHTSDRARGQRKVIVVKTWKRYKKIGQGSFGAVWLEHEDIEKDVRAVKEISKSATSDPLRVDHMLELSALGRLSKFQDVFAHFYGWYENDDSIFLAMEYFELGDLEGYLTADLTEDDAKLIATQLLEGLKVLQAQNWAHRDLKPRNIFVVKSAPDWWVKIGDFGISKRMRSDQSVMHTRTGTPEYMAPEMIPFIWDDDEEEPEYTIAVDIWSLGCVVYRLLTQTSAFPTERKLRAFCRSKIVFPITPLLENNVSEDGVRFLQALIVPDPKARLNPVQAMNNPWIKSYIPAKRVQLQRELERHVPVKLPLIETPKPESFGTDEIEIIKPSAPATPILKASDIESTERREFGDISSNVDIGSGIQGLLRARSAPDLQVQSNPIVSSSLAAHTLPRSDCERYGPRLEHLAKMYARSWPGTPLPMYSTQSRYSLKSSPDTSPGEQISQDQSLPQSYTSELPVPEVPMSYRDQTLDDDDRGPSQEANRQLDSAIAKAQARSIPHQLKSIFKAFRKKKPENLTSICRAATTIGVSPEVSIRYACSLIYSKDEKGQMYNISYIPIVVAKCTSYLQEHAAELNGVFRDSELRDTYIIRGLFEKHNEYGKDVDLTKCRLQEVAALLQQYLVRLPEPIIPINFYNRFCDCLDYDLPKSVEKYQELISILPSLNRKLLVHMLHFFQRVTSESKMNGTTALQLATLFHPGFLRRENDDTIDDGMSVEILKSLIQKQECIPIQGPY